MTLVFRPVAPPRLLDKALTDEEHRRLVEVTRKSAPHKLILAQYFQTAEEVVATLWDKVPEGVKPSWDMFLTPVFRGFFARGGVAFHPEIEDLFLNPHFLQLVRDYWGAQYAHADEMYFNLQGPCPGGDTAHIDATRFRGISMNNSPPWLMNVMCKSGLFQRWQAKKAQVACWWYKGAIGGGFTYWPDGPDGQPQQLKAPMWGRGVVVENEMMYHTAEANGPSALRMPAGLAFESVLEPDGNADWKITTGGQSIQSLPVDEIRMLVHWSADIYMDFEELRTALDQSDDLTHEQVFDIFIADLRKQGVPFKMPADPMFDPDFIALLSATYNPGTPAIYPPTPVEPPMAA